MAAGMIVGKKYKLTKKIGSGSFGEIYAGYDVDTHFEIACKVESNRSQHPQLLHEHKVYRTLNHSIGIPTVLHVCSDSHRNYLIMDLLGPSLEDLFNFCRRKFSTTTVAAIADQMIARIEYIHSRSYVHRDIKPDNFLIGRAKNASKIYIVDFGLAKKYRDPRTHVHVPFVSNKSLTGTARYASRNAHRGYEQSRRDDLEALGYVLVYFLRGDLPWQGLRADTKKQKYEKIAELKMCTPLHVLCQQLPGEFLSYFHHVRYLEFHQPPDYLYLRHLFRRLLPGADKLNKPISMDWTVLHQNAYQKNHSLQK
uniref:Protein kinase domain-containing protein n=1 Tax=Panagrolaimus sp. JU765 TaxID=591449 RepID=A0AC34QTF4_9BILA